MKLNVRSVEGKGSYVRYVHSAQDNNDLIDFFPDYPDITIITIDNQHHDVDPNIELPIVLFC